MVDLHRQSFQVIHATPPRQAARLEALGLRHGGGFQRLMAMSFRKQAIAVEYGKNTTPVVTAKA